MRILVTGGSGFIGSNFIEKYANKYDIVAPASSEMDLMRLETIRKVFASTKIDAVVHLAYCSENSSEMQSNNLAMFKNIQYASILAGVKKLIVVGDAADLMAFVPSQNTHEDELQEPADTSGLTRYLITRLASLDKISVTLRINSIYGAKANIATNQLNNILARAYMGKKELYCPNKTFSTIYIDDACKIISAFVENDFPKGDYNIASNESATYLDFAKRAKSVGKKNDRELEIIDCEDEQTQTLCIDKLMSIMPTMKFTSLNAGINRTLGYLAEHKGQCRAKKT